MIYSLLGLIAMLSFVGIASMLFLGDGIKAGEVMIICILSLILQVLCMILGSL